jgi:hypothetical protein
MLTPRVVTTVLPGGITVNTSTSTVSVTLIPFIRARKIYFKIEGLLPNMRHRPFFDGKDVSDWCREEAFVNRNSQTWPGEDPAEAATLSGHPDTSSALISDSNGIIEGTFYLPNRSSLRFRTGVREFKVRDWASSTDANALSIAYASYTARGYLQNDVTTITTIMPLPIIPPRQIDPIAQSFLIEKPSGCFITSAEVFMKTKSSTVPLRVQIRAMENGIPTAQVLPGADVYVLPASVKISNTPVATNASHKTVATFDTPVFLEGFTEYALVILAESVDYTAWTAVTTEFQVGSTTKRIMKQPAMGSFFKSQNGSTWTPDQSRDLMFNLNRAVFDTDGGYAVFENAALPTQKLGANPIEVLAAEATPTVRVTQPNHGHAVGATVTLSGLTATRGLSTGNLNAAQAVSAVLDADHYEFVSAGTSTTAGSGGGSVAKATKGVIFSTAYPNINSLALPSTGVAWTAKYTSGVSPPGLESPYVKGGSWLPLFPNSNNDFNAPAMVASAGNETANVGEKSLNFKAVLSTSTNYLSPMVDLSRLSMLAIANRIDNPTASPTTGFNAPGSFVAETDPNSGSAAAKHLTVPVTLSQPAIGVKVIFAANRPANSFIDLYYRTLDAGAGGAIGEQEWVLAAIDQVIPTDDDPAIFREYVYTIPNDGTDLEPFDTYQFKFVLRSQSVAKVPRIRDLRGIALGT